MPEPTEGEIQEDTVVTFGGEIKSLGDNRFGGYLVRFTNADDLDLSNEFFDKDTDYDMDFPGQSTAYWNHGQGVLIGENEVGGKKKLGKADLKMDEVGVWAEIILQERDDYEKRIAQMARDGKLGWSSGTAGHLVTYQSIEGKEARYIKSWPLGKDASLTHRPCEPRNSVIPLKSFISDNTANQTPEGKPEATQVAASEGGEEKADIQLQGEAKMEITPELQALLDAGAENAVKKFRESEPAEKTADIKITKDESEQPFKNPSEFFQAVKVAGQYPASIDKRLLPLKQTGMGETVPSHGGFLVPEEVSSTWLEKMWGVGTVLSVFSRDPVQGNSMTYNVVDETSRADGSRYGGLRGYWLGEAAQKTASHPLFRQLELKLKKVAALVYATDELLEDSGALQSWIQNTVPDELRFCVEDAIINGTGVAQPLGILSSPALLSLARTTTDAFDAADVGRMWGRRYAGVNDYVWLASPTLFPSLLNLVVGTTPVFLPAGGLSGLPYATLLGRPYYETEYQPAAGTAGDLILVSPSCYKMIEKSGGIQSASSIHVNFIYDESVFRFVYRIDGCPLWASTVTMHDAVTTVSPYVTLAATTI